MASVTETRDAPRLRVVDDLLAPEEVAALLAAVDPDRLAALGVRLRADGSGRTAELRPGTDPALDALERRLAAAIGIDPAPGTGGFRLRIAGRGDFHPLHVDDYTAAASRLVATAVVYLTACQGGATRFPHAEPSLHVRPTPGRAVLWLGVTPAGDADPASRHAIAPVTGGERVTLTWLCYAVAAAVRVGAGAAAEGPLPLVAGLALEPAFDAHPGFGTSLAPRPGGAGRTLVHLADQGTPETTRRYLREACAARGLGYEERDPASVDPREDPLPPGTLLYASATSWTADQVEAQLWQPGVGTIWRRPEGPYLRTLHPIEALARAGLPVPRMAWLRTRDRDTMRGLAAWLGGPPVVLRVPGGEGGVGVMRADSLPALYGLADLLLSRGHTVRLSAYVPDAMHWRLVVVGDRVVTAYLNPIRPDDFRSAPSDAAADYGVEPPPEMAAIAVGAAHALGFDLAGVDVLRHPSGRLYLLESNTPCYFAQATEAAGIDVAGPLVDHLVARADAWDAAG